MSILRTLLTIFAAGSMLLLAACGTPFEAKDQIEIHDGLIRHSERPVGDQGSYSLMNWPPQEYAGLTATRLIYPQDRDDPVVVELVSGKEAEGAVITFTTPDGNLISYDASGLKAFEGQIARAELERALAESAADVIKEVGPQGIQAIVDIVCAAVLKGACL